MIFTKLNRGLNQGGVSSAKVLDSDLTTMEKKELLEVAGGLDLSGLKSKTNLQIIEAIKGARNE